MSNKIILLSIFLLLFTSCSDIYSESIETEKPTQTITHTTKYEEALGYFDELYKDALNEDDYNKQIIKYAKAEEELLNSMVVFPLYNKEVKYKLTRVVDGSYKQINGNVYSLKDLLVTDKIINKQDYDIISKFLSLNEKVDYLSNNGYTFVNEYNALTFEEINSLNIWSKLSVSNLLFARQCYGSLLNIDSNGNLYCELAKDYSVSKDGLTYTFNIDENAYWYDAYGNKLSKITSDDFVLGLKYCLENLKVNKSIKNINEYVNGVVSFEEIGIEVIDEDTLNITFVNDSLECLYLLSNELFPISQSLYNVYSNNPHCIDLEKLEFSSSYLPIEISNEKIILGKNKNVNDANLDRLTLFYELAPSKNTINKFLNNQYSELTYSYNSSLKSLIGKTKDIDNYITFDKDNNSINFSSFNFSRKNDVNNNSEFINDYNFRRSLYHLLNLSEMLQTSYDIDYINNSFSKTFTTFDDIYLTDSISFDDQMFLKDSNYKSIIDYFASQREDSINYFNLDANYNEEKALEYFNKFLDSYNVSNVITLDVLTNNNYYDQVVVFKNIVERVLNGKIIINIDNSENSFVYYDKMSLGEYDMIFNLSYNPDSCLLESYLKLFEKESDYLLLFGLYRK